MLLQNKGFKKTMIAYAIGLAVAMLCILMQSSTQEKSMTIAGDSVIFATNTPHDFIVEFISMDQSIKTYDNLMKIKDQFDNTFKDALNNEILLFEVYFNAALSSKHPNLYKKLSLLEHALVSSTKMIQADPELVEFRKARLAINQAVPVFFRNYAQIREDLKYLEKSSICNSDRLHLTK